MSFPISWTELKAIIDDRGIPIQWIDLSKVYLVSAVDGPFQLHTEIQQDGGADVTDFETNYKGAANANYSPAVSQITNGQAQGNAKVAADGSGDNRLFVDQQTSVIVPDVVPSISPKILYEDMNATTGGIARGTTISTTDGRTVVYSYSSGSGRLFSFLLTLATASQSWKYYLKIDGNEVFTSSGIDSADLASISAYNFNPNTQEFHGGIGMDGNTLRWRGPLQFPIKFESSIEISIERTGAPDKDFEAGLVVLTKD